MTISTVSICNRALDLLGADPITSLEDGSKAANLCQRNFEPSADSVLRLYPWNAALRRARLPAPQMNAVRGSNAQRLCRLDLAAIFDEALPALP